MTSWWWPTARSISWVPLAGVALCLGAVSVVAREVGVLPVGLVGIAAAALAAAQVAGTRDPAAALLAAVPTSVAARRARRLAFLLPAGIAMWLIAAGERVPGQLALVATGLAVAVWANVPAGAVVPLVWVVVARSAGFDWELSPGLVIAVAGAALWAGRNR